MNSSENKGVSDTVKDTLHSLLDERVDALLERAEARDLTAILERWRRNKADTPARLVERCTIILLSAEGLSNEEQGRRLGVD